MPPTIEPTGAVAPAPAAAPAAAKGVSIGTLKFFPDDETDAVATGTGADVGVLEILIPWLCVHVDVCVGVTVEEADADGDDELEGVGV